METILSGVRILDLTRFLAGPYGTVILGDLGAEVIKVEPVGMLTEERRMKPVSEVDEVAAGHIAINRNKKSILLDLKKPRGREIFYELVKRSDVVVDNFRPGTMEKLSIDYVTLKEINPGIICASGTAFGTTGPWSRHPAFDPIIQALTGLMSLTGEPGEAPVPVGVPIADLATGISVAHGVLAALYGRERDGKGRRVEVTMVGATLALLMFDASGYLLSGKLPEARGRNNMPVQPYGVFETKDGSIVVAAHRSFDRFCKALGCMELVDDSRFDTLNGRVLNRKALTSIIAPILKTKTSREWTKRLEATDVPCCTVNTLENTFSHPQIRESDMIAEFDYVLGGSVRVVGNPVKISDTPPDTKKQFISPPMPGQNTREILTRLLGYGPDQISSLITEGAIGEWA
jgi:CoA:oxalate CoA-transferase